MTYISLYDKIICKRQNNMLNIYISMYLENLKHSHEIFLPIQYIHVHICVLEIYYIYWSILFT